MEGNEPEVNSCIKCKEKCDDDYYTCDSCLERIHKKCSNVTSSEARCIPLQKRVLLLICEDCKQLIARLPHMLKIMEDMKKDIESLKSSVQCSIQGKNFATIVKTQPINAANKVKETLPTLILKPKTSQKGEASKAEIKKSINPSALSIGIRNMTETKQGNIVIKCETKQDMDKFKVEAANKLSGKYDFESPKKINPRVKIIGYTGNKSLETLEESIRAQNRWIDTTDYLKVTYLRKFNNKNYTTIYAECSGSLYSKMLDCGKVHIGWERLPVYEDIKVLRCYNCQGFNHKSDKCNGDKVCWKCGSSDEEHNAAECQREDKKCNNCITANKQYKLNHAIDHGVSDSDCPSLKYFIDRLRSKIDYST